MHTPSANHPAHARRPTGHRDPVMLRNDPTPSSPSATHPDSWLALHGDALWRFAIARLGHKPAVAEELIQETFLAALQSRHAFRADASERTWLISILRRKIADHLRASGRPASNPAAAAHPSDPYDDRGCWRLDPGHWPDRRTAASAPGPEFRAALEACLQRIPPSLAETFILREVRCLAPEAVCRVMDISPENLWVRLHRAREALRRCLSRTQDLAPSTPGGPR